MTPHAGAQDQVNGDTPDIYTMRQLNQRTAFVIDQVIKNGPALITRLGRFAAMITPIEPNLESRVLSQLAREIGQSASETSVQVGDRKPEVYTIRQLGQQTAFIIEQIEKNGPALITRNGHFVIMISPLRGDVEARVLSEMAREIGQRGGAGPSS
jgi:antitoxin (DNA-binding transcriptional repressor) of toxin-antitoxin stability system